MLGIALLSKWHVHAVQYANELKAMEGVRLSAVWDEEPERGRKWAEELGIDFEADLETILKRDDVDAVCVATPTSLHTEVMVAAANAGKHIFTEKVMALTTEDCKKIAAAVEKAGVKFCISFPHRTAPANLFAKKAVDDGLLGDITLMRVRNAHNGAVAGWLPEYFYDAGLCGGGAMMDLGAHPMYLSRWILGKPVRITSMFTGYTGREVEDNAVSLIEYGNNALAVVETGFVSQHSLFSLELYGTKGSLMVGGVDGSVKLFSDTAKSEISGWVTPAQLPKPLLKPTEQWVRGILEGTEIHFGLEEGIQLTELMEAAYISQKERRTVDFD